MDSPQQITSEQLARHVSGEADADERALVEHWAASDPANQRELDAFREIWRSSGGPLPEVDVDAAWNIVQRRISATGGRGRVIPLWGRTAVRWAAAAAVLIGLFIVARQFSPNGQEVMAYAQPVSAVLEDSTHVVVSPASRVEAHMGNERRIALQGRAWFEVARDTQRPFIVEAQDLRITVLGTGFEVSAYDTTQVWSVRVRHGRVRVEAGADQVELAAGERASFDRASGQLARSGPVTVEVWGDRIVQFDNAPLGEVAAELQRIYHVRVDLTNEALARCRLTATFDNEPIGQVLSVISSTFGLRVDQLAPDHYALDGDGC